MSELMGGINAEPKPGMALRTMMEQHRHLDEFMTMVKAKMDLDEKYLRELKTLRDSWNPEWNGSGTWPLIAPFVTHIDNEIAEREKAATELDSRFTSLLETPPPNSLQEDGFHPLEILESVQNTYNHYDQCHKIVRTPESISELQRWHKQVISDNSFDLADWARLELRVLPKHDREYRGAVVAQQTAVENAVKWQADILPDILERHQQRAEDVNSFLNILFTYCSALHSHLSISSSAGLSSNRGFLSSEFISPRHDETGQEASHALLRAVDHRNYMLDRAVAQPIFGLGVEKTISLINELLNDDAHLLFLPDHGSQAVTAFELEKKAARSGLSALPKSFILDGQLGVYARYALVMDEPLLPLPWDTILKYRNGMSRTKLSSVMNAYLPLARQEVLKLLMKLGDNLNQFKIGRSKEPQWTLVAGYLSHNNAAAGIIESIWRKWDVENDRPLPEGVERVWNELNWESKVVWSKD